MKNRVVNMLKVTEEEFEAFKTVLKVFNEANTEQIDMEDFVTGIVNHPKKGTFPVFNRLKGEYKIFDVTVVEGISESTT